MVGKITTENDDIITADRTESKFEVGQAQEFEIKDQDAESSDKSD